MKGVGVTLTEVQEFFFWASLKGYAGQTEKTTIPQLPGSKFIHHSHRLGDKGTLDYADLYYSSETGKSFGFTIITFNGIPVWRMQYDGFSDKTNGLVIPFLKERLRTTYGRRVFLGGRGCDGKGRNALEYFNYPKGDFQEFSGYDVIIEHVVHPTEKVKGRTVYRHDYHGDLIIPLKP